eukprot:779615-Lingulodinium_polyedra.AAC.1
MRDRVAAGEQPTAIGKKKLTRRRRQLRHRLRNGGGTRKHSDDAVVDLTLVSPHATLPGGIGRGGSPG